jgi:hypothetical protein
LKNLGGLGLGLGVAAKRCHTFGGGLGVFGAVSQKWCHTVGGG